MSSSSLTSLTLHSSANVEEAFQQQLFLETLLACYFNCFYFHDVFLRSRRVRYLWKGIIFKLSLICFQASGYCNKGGGGRWPGESGRWGELGRSWALFTTHFPPDRWLGNSGYLWVFIYVFISALFCSPFHFFCNDSFLNRRQDTFVSTLFGTHFFFNLLRCLSRQVNETTEKIIYICSLSRSFSVIYPLFF